MERGRAGRIGVGAVVALGLALRLWRLGEPSLWHDEVLELERALSPWAMLLAGRPIDQDPPLAALLWRLWIELGGGGEIALATSEWWLRLPSALLGVLTVALGGAWAARRFGRRVGGLLALLLAAAPTLVHYGQELNQYAAVPLLALGLVIAWEGAGERGRRRDWWRLSLLSVLALATHYGMAFPIAAISLDLAWRAWRRSSSLDRRRLARHLALLAAWLLVLLAGLGLAERATTPHLDARLFGTGLFKELDYLLDTGWRELLVFFVLPFAGGAATWIAGALAVLATWGGLRIWQGEMPCPGSAGDGGAASAAAPAEPDRSGRRLIGVGLLGSLALVYPVDILGLYPLGHRWALFALPLYLLCLAAALDGLWRLDRGLGWLATGLVLVNLLLFLPQQDAWNGSLSVPREAMRPAVEVLAEGLAPGDVVYVTDGGWPAFDHYRKGRLDAALRVLRGRHPDLLVPEVERDRILAAREGRGRIWLLVARAGPAQAELEAALVEAGFEIDPVAELPGLQLRLARPRSPD